MSKIIIMTDSTCDLSQEIIDKYDFKVLFELSVPFLYENVIVNVFDWLLCNKSFSFKPVKV